MTKNNISNREQMIKRFQLTGIIIGLVLTISSCKKVGPQEVEVKTFRVVSTIAGGSGSGASGAYADGTGSQAAFNGISSMVTDAAGNIYVADEYNQRIRKVTPEGAATTLAGSGQIGNENGTGSAAQFSYPEGIAIDASGNLYVADFGNNVIRKITPGGVVTNYAGSGEIGYADGPAATAKFYAPSGVAVDKAGNLYVSESYNRLIRKITPAGIVSTYACTYEGGSNNGGYAYNGPAASLRFHSAGPSPSGIAVDPSGIVYAVDRFNHFIYKITTDGKVSTIGCPTGDKGSEGIAAVYRDGDATIARFNYPQGIACDGAGNVYVGDFTNNRVRKITPEGTVSSVAGNGALVDVDGLSAEASFFGPACVAVGPTGNVYVGETNMIRKIETLSTSSTLKNTWSNPQSWGNPK